MEEEGGEDEKEEVERGMLCLPFQLRRSLVCQDGPLCIGVEGEASRGKRIGAKASVLVAHSWSTAYSSVLHTKTSVRYGVSTADREWR